MPKSMRELEMDNDPIIRGISCSYFTKGTIFSSVFNLLTTIIGAGTLALPFAFREGGLIFSSILFFIVMVIAIIIGLFLYDSQKICKDIFPSVEIKGYADLAELTLGKIGRIIVLIVLIVLLYLSLVAYMIYTRDQLELIIDFALLKTNHVPPCWIFHNCAVVTAMAFLPLFPITLLKNLSPLQFTSTISIICVVFVAVIITVKAGYYISDESSSNATTKIVLQTSDTSRDIVGLFPSRPQGAITCISYCGLCFLCHFQLFSLEKELHKPKRWKLNFIVVSSILVAYIIYNFVAFAGYYQFGGKTSEDIMTNFPSDGILETLARIALFFTLLFSYPVLFHPTRSVINELCVYTYEICKRRSDSLCIQSSDSDEETLLTPSNSMFKKKERNMMYRREIKPSNIIWICESWILFSITFLPAAFIPNVGIVWNFVGSIGGTLILYIFPPLFLLRLRYFAYLRLSSQMSSSLRNLYCSCSLWKDIVAMVIIIWGIFVLVAGNYSAIEDIFQKSNTVSRYQYNCKVATNGTI